MASHAEKFTRQALIDAHVINPAATGMVNKFTEHYIKVPLYSLMVATPEIEAFVEKHPNIFALIAIIILNVSLLLFIIALHNTLQWVSGRFRKDTDVTRPGMAKKSEVKTGKSANQKSANHNKPQETKKTQ